jgi:hypothetical protein
MVNRVWDGEIFDTFILLDIGAFDLELGIEWNLTLVTGMHVMKH